MNSLRGVYTIWYRDILRFWRDKMRMVSSIVFPLLFLFVFGSGLSTRMGSLGPGIDFTQFMFPGIIGMTVLMICGLGQGVWFPQRSAGSTSQPCLSCGWQDAGSCHHSVAPRNTHPDTRPGDWHRHLRMDDTQADTIDVPARRFSGFSWCPASHPYQVYGSVSGGDADAHVPHDIPVRGLLPR